MGMPEGGRTHITEECFAMNVLEFATNFTMIKALNNAGEGTWEKFEQTDLRACHPYQLDIPKGFLRRLHNHHRGLGLVQGLPRGSCTSDSCCRTCQTSSEETLGD